MKVHEIDVHPALPERIAWLNEIARNVWSAWSPEAGDLFARLDPEAWERLEHNPVALLRGMPQERLDRLAADESFVAMVARVARRLDAYASTTRAGWCRRTPMRRRCWWPTSRWSSASHECLPVYSGGLGVLAGDHLKSASDLGAAAGRRRAALPQGYFRQYLDAGRLAAGALPARTTVATCRCRLVRRRRRARRVVRRGRRSPSADRPRAACWRVQVGRVPLLPARHQHRASNAPERPRASPTQLYGGDREHAHPPGDPARHRRRARAAARSGIAPDGLPHERGPLGVPGAGAHRGP